MDRFETVMMKHGEHGVQAILENWERYMGQRPAHTMTLEQRWETFLRQTESNLSCAAA